MVVYSKKKLNLKASNTKSVLLHGFKGLPNLLADLSQQFDSLQSVGRVSPTVQYGLYPERVTLIPLQNT
ncbi:hypothetical protein P879_10728 [Paragonimus westermani]|uniref:Uncharacterized protein n=1 Tax=Paragonimus westermani TaxID=34504 RepID=A0A8T0D669_9TREM|nr:hypothetical protein P879_10728 [Paragonimus westermani]